MIKPSSILYRIIRLRKEQSNLCHAEKWQQAQTRTNKIVQNWKQLEESVHLFMAARRCCYCGRHLRQSLVLKGVGVFCDRNCLDEYGDLKGQT